jgi:hypothetical protein
VSIVLSNMLGISDTVRAYLYRPSDGASVGSVNIYGGGGGAINVTLPETGVYTLLVDPAGVETGSIDVRVTGN